MTDNDDQSRSSQAVMDAQEATAVPGDGGVGGRQAPTPPPHQGGAYLPNGGFSKFSTIEPQEADLHRMGLPPKHIHLAMIIGVPAFLAMWRIVGSDPAYLDRHGVPEIRMRPYKSFLRYQRNRYIKALSASGLAADVIKNKVRSDLGEKLSLRHIYRVAGKK